jgi:hypothetical protein
MTTGAQIELWHAEKVATQVTVAMAANGVHYAGWGETRVSETDLERLVAAVPATMSAALSSRAYYFVPLAIADTGDIMIAPAYTVDLGDRAICHRNATFGTTEAVFLSTRLVEDRFGLAFEFFINVAHNFVEAAGVPESFSSLVWTQAAAQGRSLEVAGPRALVDVLLPRHAVLCAATALPRVLAGFAANLRLGLRPHQR